MIALKPESQTLASQFLYDSWLVEVWGWRASLRKEKGPLRYLWLFLVSQVMTKSAGMWWSAQDL